MGKAAVDLPNSDPNPTKPPGSIEGDADWDALATVDTASADDLLAQLATDEVDRLLREAEAGEASSPSEGEPTIENGWGDATANLPATDAGDLPQTAASDSGELSLDPLTATVLPGNQQSVTPPAEPSVPAISNAHLLGTETFSGGTADLRSAGQTINDPEIDAKAISAVIMGQEGSNEKHSGPPNQVGDIRGEAFKPTLVQTPEAIVSQGGTPLPSMELSGGTVLKAVVGPETEEATSLAERQLLKQSLHFEQGQIPVKLADAPEVGTETVHGLDASKAPADLDQDQLEVEDGVSDESLPLILRPLEWLNAPLAACPDPVRRLLGALAMMTLLNAIAIFIYVAFFRK